MSCAELEGSHESSQIREISEEEISASIEHLENVLGWIKEDQLSPPVFGSYAEFTSIGSIMHLLKGKLLLEQTGRKDPEPGIGVDESIWNIADSIVKLGIGTRKQKPSDHAIDLINRIFNSWGNQDMSEEGRDEGVYVGQSIGWMANMFLKKGRISQMQFEQFKSFMDHIQNQSIVAEECKRTLESTQGLDDVVQRNDAILNQVLHAAYAAKAGMQPSAYVGATQEDIDTAFKKLDL